MTTLPGNLKSPTVREDVSLFSWIGWIPSPAIRGKKIIFPPFPLFLIPLLQQVLQLIHKFVDALKLPVDRCEPHICNLVKHLKLTHDLPPYHRTGDLFLSTLLGPFLNPRYDLFQHIHGYGPLLTGLFKTAEDLIPVKGFPAAILLNHNREHIFDMLIGGKPPPAPETLPPAPYRVPFLGLP